ncbi:hypothetical protein HK102_006155 [Quaeritorhiza haematococci]|nr:hypothetical protein HK102_006155 [Quaeritorhiza haematococci]
MGHPVSKCILRFLSYWGRISQVIIPAVIQKVFRDAQPSDKAVPRIDEVTVQQFTDNGVDAKFQATVENTKLPFSFLSGSIEAPVTFRVSDADSGKELVAVSITKDNLKATGQEDIRVSLDPVTVLFKEPSAANQKIKDLLPGLLGEGQLPETMKFKIEAAGVNFNLMGVPITGVDLYREQTINITQLMAAVSSATTSSSSLTASLTNALTNNTESQLPGGVSIGISELNVKVNGNAIDVRTSGTLNFPMPFTIKLGVISVDALLNNEKIASVQISGISLSRETKSFDIGISITPVAPRDPEAFRQLVENVVKTSQFNGITLGIGNITVQNADGKPIPWIQAMTDGVSGSLSVERLSSGVGSGASMIQFVDLNNLLKINTIDIALLPNSSVGITTSVNLNNPIKASVNIAGFSGKITSNNEGQPAQDLIGFSFPAINIGGQGQQQLNLGMNVTFADNPQAQAIAAQIAQAVVARRAASLAIGGVQFSSEDGVVRTASTGEGGGALLNSLASIIRIPVPLDRIAAQILSDSSQQQRAQADQSQPPMLALQNVTFNVDQNGFNFNIAANSALLKPFPVNLNVPFAQLALGVDDAQLANVRVSQLGITANNQNIGLGASIELPNDPKLPAKLNEYISSLLAQSKPNASLILRGLSFGSTPQQAVSLFSNLNMPVPVEALFTGNGTNPVLSLVNVTAIDPKFNGLSFQCTNTGFTLSPQLEFNNPLPVTGSIPFVGFDMGVANQRFMTVGVRGTGLTAGRNTLQMQISTDFGNTPELQTGIANLANEVMSSVGGTVKIDTPASFGGLALGASPEQSIPSLRGLQIQLPLTQLMQMGMSAVNSAAANGSLASMLPAIDLASINPRLEGVTFNTLASGFNLAPQIRFNNPLPFPVNGSLPFASFSLGLGQEQFMATDVKGIQIVPGENAYGVNIDARFGNSTGLATNVGQLVNEVMNGSQSLSTPISVGGIRFGLAESPMTFLGGLNVQVNRFIPSPGSLMGSAGAAIPSISLQSLAPQIDGVSFETNSQGITLRPAFQYNNPLPFPVSGSLPFVAFDVAMAGEKFVTTSVQGIQLQPAQRNAMSLTIGTNFANSPKLANSISNVVGGVMAGEPINTPISVRGVQFGLAESPMNFASGVEVQLPVNQLLEAGKQAAGNATGSIASILDLSKINPRLNSASFETVPQGFTLAPSVSFNNPLPFPVNGSLGFVSIDFNVATETMMANTLTGISLVPGANTLNLNLGSRFGTTDSLQNNVATLVNQIAAGGDVTTAASIKNFAFGSTQETAVQTFKNVEIPIPVTQIAKFASTALSSGAATGGNSTFSGLSLTSLFPPLANFSVDAVNPQIQNIEVSTTQQGMRFGAAAAISNPLPLAVKLGFAQGGLSLAGTPFTTFSANGIELNSGADRQNLAPSAELAFTREAELPNKVNAFIQAAMNGQSSQVTISNVAFGKTSAEAITTFQKCQIPLTIPFGALTAAAGPAAAGAGSALGRIMGQFNFNGFSLQSLNGLRLAATDAGVDFGAAARVVNPLPVTVNFGFGALDVAAKNDANIGRFKVNNITIQRGETDLSLNLGMALQRGEQVQQGVAGLFNDFTTGQTSSVKLANVAFGVSEQEAFNFLSGVTLPIPLPFDAIKATIANAGAAGGNSSAAGGITSILNGNALNQLRPTINGLRFATTPTGITSTVQASLGTGTVQVPISIDMGFVAADVALGGNRLVSFSTENFKVSPQQNLAQLALPVTLDMLPMDPQVPAAFAQIANPLVQQVLASMNLGPAPAAQQAQPVNIGINGVRFGASKDRAFDLLSGVNVAFAFDPASLNSLIPTGGQAQPTPQPGAQPAANGPAGIAMPSITEFALNTVATGFAASAAAQFQIAQGQESPVVADLGFGSAQVLLGDAKLADAALGKTQVQANGAASTSLNIALPNDQGTQQQVAAAAQSLLGMLGFINGTRASFPAVSLRGITFGASQDAQIPLLSQMQITVDPNSLMNGVQLPSFQLPESGDLRQALPVRALKVNLGLNARGIGGTTQVALNNQLPPLSLNLPWAALDVVTDNGVRIAAAQVQGIAVSQQDNAPIQIDVELANNQGDFYVQFVQNLLASQPSTLRANNILFGTSPQEAITIARAIDIPISVSTGSLSRLGLLKIDSPQVNLIPPSANIPFTSRLPLDLAIGTTSMGVAVSGSTIASLNIPNIALNEGTGNINAGVDINIGGLFGAIPGGLAAIFGGGFNKLDTSVNNLRIVDAQGQPVSWLNTAMNGRSVKIDLGQFLGAFTGGGNKNKRRDLAFATVGDALIGVANGSNLGAMVVDSAASRVAKREPRAMRPRRLDLPQRT